MTGYQLTIILGKHPAVLVTPQAQRMIYTAIMGACLTDNDSLLAMNYQL